MCVVVRRRVLLCFCALSNSFLVWLLCFRLPGVCFSVFLVLLSLFVEIFSEFMPLFLPGFKHFFDGVMLMIPWFSVVWMGED